MNPIHDLGPIDAGRHGIDRAHDALEISRTTPGRAADGLDGAADARLERATAARPGTPDSKPTPETESAKSDRIELSLAARALSAAEDPEITAERSRHVAAMKSAIEAGEFVSPERIERAARRLLGN